jgi:hypothetical protein
VTIANTLAVGGFAVLTANQVNAANGVAGLDASGNLVGPILLYNNTAAQLNTLVPQNGQAMYSTDTHQLGIGDGTTTWAGLPHFFPPVNEPRTTELSAALVAAGIIQSGTTPLQLDLGVGNGSSNPFSVVQTDEVIGQTINSYTGVGSEPPNTVGIMGLFGITTNPPYMAFFDPLATGPAWAITGYDPQTKAIALAFDPYGLGSRVDFAMGTGAGKNVLFSLGGATGTPNAISWFGAAPAIQQHVPAAATDATSTQNLVNAIRMLLINYGLAVSP